MPSSNDGGDSRPLISEAPPPLPPHLDPSHLRRHPAPGAATTAAAMPAYYQPSRPRRGGKAELVVIASYVLDWIVVIVAAGVSFVLGNIDPNKRPFSLEDPDISFPYTVHETIPSWLLVTCDLAIPAVVILVVALVFVPGPTVSRGTPGALAWRRRLWEWHAGWLGLGVSLALALFVTSGLKNLFGKPRPDLLARCRPDLADVARYVVGGGVANASSNGQLVSAAICRNPDASLLRDGFRSFPSGHSSSAAAGLLYLSLFVAAKFGVAFPFLAPGGYPDEAAFSAFPSRAAGVGAAAQDPFYDNDQAGLDDPAGGYELADHPSTGSAAAAAQRLAPYAAAAARRRAAAPPVYLLAVSLCPFFGAVFIASSRWFDFRHHGFDILFGFALGCACAVFAFRLYHPPAPSGAGWAWGPRSADKAFWAGVGSYSYATGRGGLPPGAAAAAAAGDEEEGGALEGRRGARRPSPAGGEALPAKRDRSAQSTGASA